MDFWKTADFIVFSWYSFHLGCKEGCSAIAPVVIPSEEKCCIASLCAAEAPRCDQKLVIRILHLRCLLCNRVLQKAAPAARKQVARSRLCAVSSWSLNQKQAPASCQHWEGQKGTIRPWFILGLRLSQTGVWCSQAPSPWSKAQQQLAVRVPCPALSKLPQPNKASRSLQKGSCNLHISKTLHFRKSYIFIS